MKTRPRREKGFSLIELIIAIVVLTIAIGSMLSVNADVFEATVTPERINLATDLAEKEIERVEGLRFSDVINEGPTAYTGNFSNYTYQVVVSAVPVALANDPGMSEYKQVQVTVTHSTAGSVVLSTIVTNN